MDPLDILAAVMVIGTIGDIALLLCSNESTTDRVLRLVLAATLALGACGVRERIGGLGLWTVIALVIAVSQGTLVWRAWRATTAPGRAVLE
jgi:hypothetical protein